MRTLSAVRPRPLPLDVGSRFAPRRLAAAMAASSLLTLSMAPAVAQVVAPVLPTGLSVVAGQAQAVTNGNRMTVTNTSQSILNWNSFSIGAGNSVYFQQPGVTSQVLNRVTGNDPSLILGNLGSNGRVWLLNQNGVLFGQNARVDVAGLVASTLRLNDTDWLAGRFRFTEGSNAAANVLNQGEMRTSFGGSLALVSGSVGNEGLMQAPGGQVILAAGKSVELVDTGAAYLSVRITAPGGEARNLGVLEAANGRIDIHAAAVNQQGIVRADALTAGPGGEVWIKASNSITLAAGSRTSADGGSNGSGSGSGGNAGSVTLQADTGRTTVQGTVSAVGTAGNGGQVVVLGREVSVQDQARVDASGSQGGGTVIVGGGDRGQDPRYTNAQAVYFGPQASIAADATTQGDGGHIVLWSDSATRAYGTLTARGGLLGGNGGSIETSGGWLDAQPLRVDAGATHGQAGEWLLDPYNIFISNNVSTAGVGAGPTFTPNSNSSSINAADITVALANSNVTIYTGGANGGSQPGNITLDNAEIVSTSAAARSLTFIADRSISATDSTISATQGALSVELRAAQNSAGGGISLVNTSIVTGIGSTWGDILFGGGAVGQRPDGTAFTGAGGAVPTAISIVNTQVPSSRPLNAGLGSITLLGTTSNGGGQGIVLTAAYLRSRTLTIVGDAPTGEGVRLDNITDVLATQSATVLGRSLAAGVHLVDDARLAVLPDTTDTTALLTVEGLSRIPTGGSGVLIETNGNFSYGVLTGNGAGMVLRGSSVDVTTDQAVRISVGAGGSGSEPIVDASGGFNGGGTSLLIQTFGNGRNIAIDSGALVYGGSGSTQLLASGDITITGTTGGSFPTPTLLLASGSITLAGDNIALTGNARIRTDSSAATTLAFNAQSNVTLSGGGITSPSGPLAVSMQAGLGGAGTVNLVNSFVTTGPASERPGAAGANGLQPDGSTSGGDIVIGGAVPGTTPNGGSFTGAGGPDGSGVTITNTALNARNANVTIAGVATGSGGIGVLLGTGAEVQGYRVNITGDAPQGAGLVLEDTAYVGALHDTTLQGRGLTAGVRISGSAAVAVVPASPDATAFGSIQGRSLSTTTGYGVEISSAGAGYAVSFGNDSSFAIEGAAAMAANDTRASLYLQGAANTPLIDGTGGGTLFLGTLQGSRNIQFETANVIGGNASLAVQAEAGTLLVSNSALSSPGTVAVRADNVRLTGTTTISSTAAGDAIVLSGEASNSAMVSFINTAGAGALDASNSGGRWIVYATNINDSANFNAGGLGYDFVRHGAAFNGWGSDTGDGLVFSAAQTASYTGTVQTKVYDATTAATLGSVNFTLSVAGDSAVQQSNAVAFASPNAGVGIAANFTDPTPYTFRDSNNRPVYGYTVSGALSGTITPKTLTATVTVPDRVYDGTAQAFFNIGPLSGLVGTQTVVASASGTFNNKNVGVNKPITATYGLANGTNGGLASNYQFSGPVSPTGTITPLALAISGLTANNKVYDATTTATLAGTAAVSALAGDSVTLGGSVVANFNNKNVGTAKPVTVSGYSLSGTDAGNYSLVQPTGLTANITPRAYVISGLTAADKVYDATTNATLTGTASGNALAGDTVTLGGTGTGSFVDKNVGNNKTVTVSGYTLGGADAGNYTLGQPSGLTASITPRAVSVTGLTANNKVYDATTTATLAGSAAVAALASDVLTLGGTANASFADKNVGNGKAVTVTGYTLGGADAGNYTLAQPTGLTANITPRALAVAGLTAADKVYDATTAATLTGTAGVTALAGDVLSLAGTGSGSFNDKNVGNAKPVTVTGYSLSGTDAGNYTLQPLTLAASITPRGVSVTGLTANNKVYDATTAATLAGTASVAALSGDVLNLSGSATGNFVDKNVGNNKAVLVSGYTLGGADAGNYTLTQPAGLTANITPRSVTVSGLTANNKVYDATTAATLAGTGSVAALSGDVVTVAGLGSASFGDKNVGTGKAVTVTGVTLGGADAGNYTLVQPTGLTANITPRALAIAGLTAADKVYDATTAATLTGTAGVTALAGDVLNLTGAGSASFNNKNVGNAKPVTVTGYTLAGTDAGNYALQPLTLAAAITPRGVSVTGLVADNKIYDATTAATLSGNASIAALSGDVLNLIGSSATGNFVDKNVGINKAVLVSGYTLGGADAGNYTLTQPAGLTANITPRAVTLSGLTANDKIYDATTAATLSGTGSVNALSGDVVTIASTGTALFADKNVGNGKVVTVSGITLGGADAGNYTLTQPTGFTASITPRALAVAGVTALDKVYDATTAATLTGTAGVTALAGDTLSLLGTGSASFNNKNVGAAKPVTVTGYSLSGTDAGNYTLQPLTLTAAITPRGVSVTGLTANNKVYDATTAATLNGNASVAALSGDVLNLIGSSATGNFSDKNVGINKAVLVSGYTLGGADAGNYVLTQPAGLTANITPRAISVTGLSANNKVYDATTAATLSGTGSLNALSGDVVTVAGLGTASFVDKNVGVGKAVTVTGITLGGADGGNYTLVQPTGLTATITPRALTIAGLTAADKVYDATTAATLVGSAGVAALGGDVLTLTGTGAASFNNKNVGAAKPVTVTGYSLSGTDAGNYSLQPLTLTAAITPRAVSVTGLTANNKVYDATTAATLNGNASVAALSGDVLNLIGSAATGNFSDKNVGINKAVLVSGYTLGGSDAGNYVLTQPAGLTANITPRAIALTGLSANDKVYDATTAATLSGTGSLTALTGDVVTVAGLGNANFVDKNVGIRKTVTVSGITLGGADAGNYTLVQPTGLTATITPRALTIAGLTAADKVYDATTAATLVGTAGVSALGGDLLALTGTGAASFNNKNVGTAKPVTVTGYSLAGADAGNYTLQGLSLTAAITPRAVSVAGLVASNKVYDATTAATLSGNASIAALSGDVLNLLGTGSASFVDKNVGTNKTVTLNGFALGGADAGNYLLTQPAGLTANITPLALLVTGVSANNKVYDATTRATLTGTARVNAIAGDSVALGGTGVGNFDNKNVGNGKAVTVSGYTLAGADAGNYTLSVLPGLTANITPLQIALTGLRVTDKVYDATTSATLAGTAAAAVIEGDVVSVTGTPNATFDNKNVGTGKAVLVTGFALGGADAGNYTVAGSQLLAGNITPRPLAVAGLGALGKVYDGNTSVALTGSGSVAAISGDAVQLNGAPSAAFVDRNAGVAKPVAVSGYSISGADAGNYSLQQPQGVTATITPAQLVYVADPAVRSVGQLITDLTGLVTGFVAAETQATATTGALAFSTPATVGSPAGSYPIQGGGLLATNYTFSQAPGNAQALSLIDLSPTVTPVITSVAPAVSTNVAAILSAPRQAAESGLANLTASSSISADPGTRPVGDFKAVRLSSLSTADIQNLLAGRDLFKQQLLADATRKLQDNPRLADLPECQTVAQAEQGQCLITDRIKALVAERQQQPAPIVGTAPGTAPVVPPVTQTLPVIPPTPATPTAPAPAAPTPEPAPTVATAPIVPTPAPVRLPGQVDANVDPLLREVQLIRRRVLAAALPQIERKVALVIGVDNYSDKTIPTLGNAVRDARSVAQLFESRLGYEAVVLDNATKASLVGALNKLALTLGPRDSVVVYYAGHGQVVESTKLGYWLLADSNAKDPETWLSNTDISRLIGQIGASQVALISDSCYSGSLVSEERIRATPTALDPKAVLSRKSVVIMSSGGNEPVFDEGRDGHSPFAWNLMNTLNKVADWQPGGNVFERVRFAVSRELPQRPQYSASRAAGHQAGGDYLFEQRELGSK